VGSEARQESLVGTASTVTRWLLLEDPGPWGVEAVRDARMPGEVKQQLAERARRHRVRVVLIRRHGRSRPGGPRCFAVSAAVGDRWVQTTTLRDVAEVLDLDFAGFHTGHRLGLEAYDSALFLVCTHGRHDPCCAERGRPLARALAHSHPEQTWECSHFGGDRFAGNLVVLPEGLYYGRLDAESGPRIADQHAAGRLDLEHLRGRVTSSFAAQAAEWHLRSKLALAGLDDVRLQREASGDGRTEAYFSVGAERWRVTMRTTHAPPERLSCAATQLGAAPRFDLVGIEPVLS
jgi:hypothetical protein